jgi:hypothetical protein
MAKVPTVFGSNFILRRGYKKSGLLLEAEDPILI